MDLPTWTLGSAVLERFAPLLLDAAALRMAPLCWDWPG